MPVPRHHNDLWYHHAEVKKLIDEAKIEAYNSSLTIIEDWAPGEIDRMIRDINEKIREIVFHEV